MADWTKADFDSNYKFQVERRMPGGGPPPSERRSGVNLHYHRPMIAPILADRWANIVPSILKINSSEHVVIIGAAFGWGIEALINLTGATVIGVDVSDFIESTKDTDEGAEIDAAIKVVGLDPASGRGLEIKNYYYVAAPRTTVVILKEEMKTSQSQNIIQQALGNALPEWIITEDMIQEFSDAEIRTWVTEIDKVVGAAVVHITEGKPRSATELNKLTGHKCITYGAPPYEVVG